MRALKNAGTEAFTAKQRESALEVERVLGYCVERSPAALTLPPAKRQQLFDDCLELAQAPVCYTADVASTLTYRTRHFPQGPPATGRGPPRGPDHDGTGPGDAGASSPRESQPGPGTAPAPPSTPPHGEAAGGDGGAPRTHGSARGDAAPWREEPASTRAERWTSRRQRRLTTLTTSSTSSGGAIGPGQTTRTPRLAARRMPGSVTSKRWLTRSVRWPARSAAGERGSSTRQR